MYSRKLEGIKHVNWAGEDFVFFSLVLNQVGG